MSENKAGGSSWEDLANEISPVGFRPSGLATGAWRNADRSGGTMPPPDNPRLIICPPCAPHALLDEGLGGEVRECNSLGPHYFISRPASAYDEELCSVVPRLQNMMDENRIHRLGGARPQDLLFMDIETTGLSSSVPLFLIGTMHLGTDDMQVELFLARTLEEERAALAAFHERVAGRTLVTFNGKSFDWPYIEGRSLRYGLKFEQPRAHVDLLYHARRLWRGQTPNCRLQTLEHYLCGRLRQGDVPSSRIPDQYHEFLDLYRATQRGASLLAPIVHHNVWDVLTMSELLCLVGERTSPAPAPKRGRR
jgi:uncharacterized protein YprB with RNaseH-like and TPR domain